VIHPCWPTLRQLRLASFRHPLPIGFVPRSSLPASPSHLAFRAATHKLASFRNSPRALRSGPRPLAPGSWPPVIHPRWHTIRQTRLASFRHSLLIGFVPHAATHKLASFRNFPRALRSGPRPLAPGPRPPVIHPRWHTLRELRLASFRHSLPIGFVSPASTPAASAALDLPAVTHELASFRHFTRRLLPGPWPPAPGPCLLKDAIHDP